jgi:hypothetical protein
MAAPAKLAPSNSHLDFVGLTVLKSTHAAQIAKFEAWAAAGQWHRFHESHYDWWAYPIPDRSQKGFAFSVFAEEVAALQKDPIFVKTFLRGCELGAKAWGWDMYAGAPIPPAARHKNQKWHNWPIRLFKITKSLKWFGFIPEYLSMKHYGEQLIEAGKEFTFGAHDLTWLFKAADDDVTGIAIPLESSASASTSADAAASKASETCAMTATGDSTCTIT